MKEYDTVTEVILDLTLTFEIVGPFWGFDKEKGMKIEDW